MWCADITYIPVQGGFLYLVAIMDWASRRVLAWRLSNTMDTEFCLAALAEALEGYGIRNYSAGMADVRQGGTIGLPAKTLVNASMTLPPFLRMVEM